VRRHAFALFDLDGTLLRPGAVLQRAHMVAMTSAVATITGHAEPVTYRDGCPYYGDICLSGHTDAGTIGLILSAQGVPRAAQRALLPAAVRHMVARLNRTPVGEAASADLLPGARHLLERLRRNGFGLGMCTGNARPVATWKMRHTRLADLLRIGGFGDSHTEREDVVVAAAAAMTTSSRGVVVGDTPRDVTAAHHAGLPCVAVATGAASAADLLAAGADALLPNLAAPNAFATISSLLRGRRHG
jgi:phosphoglycolate phosphatase